MNPTGEWPRVGSTLPRSGMQGRRIGEHDERFDQAGRLRDRSDVNLTYLDSSQAQSQSTSVSYDETGREIRSNRFYVEYMIHKVRNPAKPNWNLNGLPIYSAGR